MSACGGDAPVCGDGRVSGGEQCDDSNAFAHDGCSTTCQIEVGYTCDDTFHCDPVCGDSHLVAAEVCDPSVGPGFEQYCAANCMMSTGRCGDHVLQNKAETCDDGNASAADGCTNACQASLGFTCANNVCDASSVDGTKTFASLTAGERTTLCSWFIGALGGPGAQNTCSGVTYTNASVSMCASNIVSGGPSCTVAAFESWVASKGSICGVMQSTDATVCN